MVLNPAGILGIFRDEKWGDLVDSVYQTNDPTGKSNGVMAVHFNLKGKQSHNAIGSLESSKGQIKANNAQVLSYWIYIPSNSTIPDSIQFGLWSQTTADWNSWNEEYFLSKDIPKGKWFPLSYFLADSSIKNPATDDISSHNIGDMGIQWWNTGADTATVWSGNIYIDNISLVGAKPTIYADFNSSIQSFSELWNNGWIDSVEWNAGPINSSTGILQFKILDGTNKTGGTTVGIQPSSAYDAKTQNLLAFWVNIDATFPDSAYIQIFAQDNVNWSWPLPAGITTYYGLDIPKNVWYPLYFNLEQATILDTASLGSYLGIFNHHTHPIGKFGLQVDGPNTWNGSIYIDRVEFINSVVSAPTPPSVVWTAADFQIMNNGVQGFYVPSYCDGTISRALDISTTNKTYVLKGNADFSLSHHKFGIVRDSIPLLDTNGVDYADTASFDIYLPSDMPADSGGIVQFIINGEATNNTWTQFDFNIDNHAMKAGKWNKMVMDLYTLVNAGTVDPSKPAQFVVQIYYPETVAWKGSVLFDSLEFTGINRSGQLSPVPLVGVENSDNAVVKEFRLYNNFPNPFNPSTNIKYDLPKESFVVIKVYDILGRDVATLVNEKQSSGRYNIKFDASNLASGMYVYRIEAGSFVKSRKMMLLK